MTDGRLNARVKCDLTENLIMKANAQVICKNINAVLTAKCLCKLVD